MDLFHAHHQLESTLRRLRGGWIQISNMPGIPHEAVMSALDSALACGSQIDRTMSESLTVEEMRSIQEWASSSAIVALAMRDALLALAGETR
jgi:hypothetical protein